MHFIPSRKQIPFSEYLLIQVDKLLNSQHHRSTRRIGTKASATSLLAFASYSLSTPSCYYVWSIRRRVFQVTR